MLVEILIRYRRQNSKIRSLSGVSSASGERLVAMTNSNLRPSLRRLASSTAYCTNSKLSRLSPPWNSILIKGDGLLKTRSRERSAVSRVMSKARRSWDTRDT